LIEFDFAGIGDDGEPTFTEAQLSWKCRRHATTCRRGHNVSLQFWPDGSVSPTQNIRCRGSLCRLEPTFYQIFGIRM
jgi:hypothetical protein